MLSEIREWIQWNCLNGSTVTWGSEEILKTTKGGITVKDLESFANSEYVKKLEKQNQEMESQLKDIIISYELILESKGEYGFYDRLERHTEIIVKTSKDTLNLINSPQ